MNHRPSISIIIPVYQVADYIVACLESVVGQEYPGMVEVIIVDDCGTDNSIDLAKEFVSRYQGPFSFRFYAHSSNRWQGAARNTGMKYATGDYLLFLDSDDELLPNSLMNLSAPLLEEQYDIVDGRMRVNVPLWDRNSTVSPGTVIRGGNILREFAKDHLAPWVCNKLYRRQLFDSNPVQFYEGIIFEDDLWTFQVALVAHSLYMIGEETYLYKVRSGSTTTTVDTDRRVRSLYIIAQEMQMILMRNGLINDRDVFWRAESYRMRLFNELRFDRDRFIHEYIHLRESNKLKWGDYFKMAGLHPIKQLRYFHYAFPQKFGAVYCYMWFRLKEF